MSSFLDSRQNTPRWTYGPPDGPKQKPRGVIPIVRWDTI